MPGALHRVLPRVRRRPPARRPERRRERDLARPGGRDQRRRAVPRRLGLGQQPQGRPRPRRRPRGRGGPPARRGRVRRRPGAAARGARAAAGGRGAGGRLEEPGRLRGHRPAPSSPARCRPGGAAPASASAAPTAWCATRRSSPAASRARPWWASSPTSAPDSSDVAFITDGRTEVGAVHPRRRAATSGLLSSVTPGQLRMSGIPKEAAVETGQAVVTGGFGVKGLLSPYPPGIPVGVVTSVGTQEVDVDRTVQVTPYVDPRSLVAPVGAGAAQPRGDRAGARVSSDLQTRAVGPATPRPLPRSGSARLGWVLGHRARRGAAAGDRDALRQRRRRHPRPDRADGGGDRDPARHPGGRDHRVRAWACSWSSPRPIGTIGRAGPALPRHRRVVRALLLARGVLDAHRAARAVGGGGAGRRRSA